MTEPTRIELRDGSSVLVRPIEPSDRETFLAAFARTSAESRYMRFLTAVDQLSASEIRYFTEVDHNDHEALIALDEATGAGVGIARFVRAPQSPVLAEAAVIVIDDWQGRGLGTALSRLLAERAREVGVNRFYALLLASNTGMMHTLEALGPTRIVDRDGALVAVEVDLPAQGVGEHMTGILRAVAGGGYELNTPAGGSEAAPEPDG